MLEVTESIGMSSYQFEPYTTVDDSAVDRDSNEDDKDDKGPVWRLNSTNWYMPSTASFQFSDQWLLCLFCFIFHCCARL